MNLNHIIISILSVFMLNHLLYAQCGGVATITDARDASVYNIIQIDGSNGPYCAGSSQCWMAENLDIGTRINGNTNQTNNGTIEKHCYNDNNANCTTFGGLYQWDEMMNYSPSDNGNLGTTQGICPLGWHLPTDNEWKCMEINLGMTQAQADATGFRGTDEGTQLRVGGTSGFEALHGGKSLGGFFNLNTYGQFWTATENAGLTTQVWWRNITNGSAQVYRVSDGKANGFSVRCIRDNAPIPLPIELLFFKAKWTNESYETATLSWETISETNNSHFEIERSIDGINFEYIKSVSGQGNSQENMSYSTLDEQPYADGISYYRLKQVDDNGNYEYSNIEALNVPEGLNFINLYPNPAINNLTVLITSSEATETIISIKNTLGQEVRKWDKRIDQGFTSFDFNISELGTGNYFIEINTISGQYHIERKFVKSNQ